MTLQEAMKQLESYGGESDSKIKQSNPQSHTKDREES